ncbi:MAG: hypothetical protein ACLVML_09180 [Candidatus Gastranaerophilaceae bacterium]|jgi:hypothetical protein|nr:hypothetical protein [Christensenellales bacterium]
MKRKPIIITAAAALVCIGLVFMLVNNTMTAADKGPTPDPYSEINPTGVPIYEISEERKRLQEEKKEYFEWALKKPQPDDTPNLALQQDIEEKIREIERQEAIADENDREACEIYMRRTGETITVLTEDWEEDVQIMLKMLNLLESQTVTYDEFDKFEKYIDRRADRVVITNPELVDRFSEVLVPLVEYHSYEFDPYPYG